MEDAYRWLDWAQKLDMLAQAGLTYSKNPFDLERYHQVREIVVEMLARYSGADFKEIHHLLDQQAGYSTPKLDVRGVVFRENKILMVRELADGGWTLPGGWVDVNESPSMSVEREVREESGYKVRSSRLMAIYDRNQHGFPPYMFHIWKIYIQCELIGGEPITSIETGGVDWFGRESIPPLSIARTTIDVLNRLFEIYSHSEWLAEFD